MLDANPPDETILGHGNTYPTQSPENQFVNINIKRLKNDPAFLSSLESAAGNNDDEGKLRKVLDILYLCTKDKLNNAASINSSQNMALLSAIPELLFEVLHRINEKYYLVASWEWNGSKYVAKLHLHLRPTYVTNGITKLQCNATFQEKFCQDGSSKSGAYPVFTYNLTDKLCDLLGKEDDVDTVLEHLHKCRIYRVYMEQRVHVILGVLGIIFRRAHNPGLLFPNESEFADNICQGLGSDLNVDGEAVPFHISHIRHDKTEVSRNIAEPASVNLSRFDYCTGYYQEKEDGEVHRNPRCTHNPRCGMILKLYETRRPSGPPAKKARVERSSLVIGVNAREVGTAGRVKRICSREGCTQLAKKGGVCQQGGVCIKHRAKGSPKKRCSSEGCTSQAQKGGVCIKHGAKFASRRKICSREGCTNIVQRRGVCIRHGAY